LKLNEFEELVAIMKKLRGENGCPWDRAQSHQTLRQYLLEETYEVLEALDDQNQTELKNELGDLLLQIVFHAQIADENQDFNIQDVVRGINEKLIRRHPHVFGDMTLTTPEAVRETWEKIKMKEGKKSVIDGVPRELSGLLRAFRIQKKAAQVGFDWNDVSQVWQKVKEEEAELKAAIETRDPAQIEEEFGDLIFSLVNLSRFIKVNPEDALRRTIQKFIRRFQAIEAELKEIGKTPADCTLAEMDRIWDKIKAKEKNLS
jgi:MazG family protein